MVRTAADYKRWETPRLYAHIWWCGDEVCNCTQPEVEEIRPNREAGYPWVHRVALWKGTFCSDAEREERDLQRTEIEVAAMEYGIVLNENLAGGRDLVAA